MTPSSVAKSENFFPFKNSSAFFAPIVVGAIPPYTKSTLSTTPPSSSATLNAAFTIAISSSFLFDCLYARINSPFALATGIRKLAIIASAGSAVCLYPVKNDRIAISVVAPKLRATSVAPVATNTGFKSEIGLAVARFPAGVPTLRICRPAKYRICFNIVANGWPRTLP